MGVSAGAKARQQALMTVLFVLVLTLLMSGVKSPFMGKKRIALCRANARMLSGGEELVREMKTKHGCVQVVVQAWISQTSLCFAVCCPSKILDTCHIDICCVYSRACLDC